MKMEKVKSSSLVEVGYDESALILRVSFQNSTYDYYNVPKRIYEELMSAHSKGQYHSNNIKNRYRNMRLW